MTQIKDVLNVFLSRIIGFVIFLVLLAIVNILSYYIQNEVFNGIVFLLNSNLWLIILFTIVLMVGEVFSALIFPFNIPGPLFSAVGAVFLVRFVFNIFLFINELLNLRLPFNFDAIYYIIAVIAFIVVLIFGYFHIFSDIAGKKKKD